MLRTRFFLFCLSCFFGLSAQTAFAADGAVGMVLDLQGSGHIEEKGVTSKLQLLAYLRPQMQITLDAGAKASFTLYATRSAYKLVGPAVVNIEANRLITIKGDLPVEKSLAEKLVLAAQSSNVIAGAVRMRLIPPRIVLIAPENGVVLLNNRPSFSWVAVEAVDFNISVHDQSDNLVASAKIKESSWQLPANIALEYGKEYSWNISYLSIKDDKTHTVKGEFSLASKADLEQIAGLKPNEKAPIEEWILYAAMLQSKQIFPEARAVWQSIYLQRPDLLKAKEMAQ